MRIFSIKNWNQEFVLFIRDWIKLLSEDKFDEACLLLDEPVNRIDNIVWDSNILKNVFDEYYWHKRKPVINNPYLMNSEKERIYFYEYNDNTGYRVDYDIPLDNEWGDLTASFSFVKKIENLYMIYLDSIHVL